MLNRGVKNKPAGPVRVDYRRCHFCGACVAICPPEAMFLRNSALAIRIDKCTSCEKCMVVCPVGALSMLPVAREVEA